MIRADATVPVVGGGLTADETEAIAALGLPPPRPKLEKSPPRAPSAWRVALSPRPLVARPALLAVAVAELARTRG